MNAKYRYRASTAEGQLVNGVVDAPSQSAALEEIRRQRLYPVELVPLSEKERAPRGSALAKAPALALFTRTVATMVGAGVALERALTFAAAQARHPDVAYAARHVVEDIRSGAGLAEAMARHPKVFSSVFVAMVAAGEESGALEETMARLADHVDETVELRGEIRSSLLYPALMAVSAGVGVIVLLLFVVPRFVGMLEETGGELPLTTRILVAASAIVIGGWWMFLLAAAVLIAAVRAWLARAGNRRQLHAWRLGWPLIGELETKYATARFTRVLGMLLRSGRPMLASLRIARNAVANLHLGDQLERAAEAVSHGKGVHVALNGILPPLATELIAVGEESGHLEDLCLRVADSYDNEVRRTLRALVALMEPTLILVFGVIVGFVALAMLQAIYSINASMP